MTFAPATVINRDLRVIFCYVFSTQDNLFKNRISFALSRWIPRNAVEDNPLKFQDEVFIQFDLYFIIIFSLRLGKVLPCSSEHLFGS